MSGPWVWAGFTGCVVALLIVDLFVIQRRPHQVSIGEAAIWTTFLVVLAFAFGLAIYHFRGPQPALEYLTGYLIEQSLSLDNIFVFVIIFSYFDVPDRLEHRVLFWGVLGALVMRGAMIGAGAFLIGHFGFILYVFGAFLVIAGVRLVLHRGSGVTPERNPVIRSIRKLLPVSEGYRNARFFVRAQRSEGGWLGWAATPLFIVLLTIETTDIIFALDSIPAIFGVTRDPFIVYSSNVFAILGLRSLYFILAGAVDRFGYLRYGVAAVLVFVGIKMLIEHFVKVPILPSLAVVAGLIAVSLLASLLDRGRAPR